MIARQLINTDDTSEPPAPSTGSQFVRYKTSLQASHIGAVDNITFIQLYTAKEIHMDSFCSVRATSLTLLTALTASIVLAGAAHAASHYVTVRIPVVSADLDLSQLGGARALYRRLEVAASIACGRANVVGLEPADDFAGCCDKALADAVRIAGRPQLILVYLSAHSERDALKYNIKIPEQVAAK